MKKTLTLTDFLRSKREQSEASEEREEGVEMLNFVILKYGRLVSIKGNEFNTRPRDSIWVYEEDGVTKATVFRNFKDRSPLKITIHTNKTLNQLLSWAGRNGRKRAIEFKR